MYRSWYGLAQLRPAGVQRFPSKPQSSNTRRTHSSRLQGELVQSLPGVTFPRNFQRINIFFFVLKFIYKNKFCLETLHTKLWLHFDVSEGWRRQRGESSRGREPCSPVPAGRGRRPSQLATSSDPPTSRAGGFHHHPALGNSEPQYIQERE